VVADEHLFVADDNRNLRSAVSGESLLDLLAAGHGALYTGRAFDGNRAENGTPPFGSFIKGLAQPEQENREENDRGQKHPLRRRARGEHVHRADSGEGAEQREADAAQPLRVARSVDARGIDELLGNRAQPCQEDHHASARLPDSERDERPSRVRGKPGDAGTEQPDAHEEDVQETRVPFEKHPEQSAHG